MISISLLGLPLNASLILALVKQGVLEESCLFPVKEKAVFDFEITSSWILSWLLLPLALNCWIPEKIRSFLPKIDGDVWSDTFKALQISDVCDLNNKVDVPDFWRVGDKPVDF